MASKKCIRVAIIGSPNVGKSSLLNRILSFKASIVSPKPHTTRNNTLGHANFGNTQIVFTDTPGYIKSGTGVWAEHLIEQLSTAIEDVDVNLVLLDATRTNALGTETILKAIANDPKTLVAINKIDIRARGKLYTVVQDIIDMGYIQTVYLISARTGQGVEHLIQNICDLAPESEWMFQSEVEMQPKQVYAAECVREKLMYMLNDEIPFQLWTRPTEWVFEKHVWKVRVDIVVTKNAHKRIVIGKAGNILKNVGIAARTELESIWGLGHLFLNVVIETDWMNSRDYISAICAGQITSRPE